jgi:hypothetical protein
MTVNFVYIDLEKGEVYTGADLKAISLAVNKPYENLVYRLRYKDLYHEPYKYILSRVTIHYPSARNPSKYRKTKPSFKV